MATLTSGQENQDARGARSSTGEDGNASASPTRWTTTTRIGCRFIFAYLMLYSLAYPIADLIHALTISKLDIAPLGQLWPMRQITQWTALRILREYAPVLDTGSGDTTFDWVQIFCILCIASVASLLWILLDRKRENYSVLWKWFTVFLRLVLAYNMFAYGFSKMIPSQMAFPALDRLVEQYGNFSPMAVLWCSVGASPAYEIFTGMAEVVGGILLLIPATAMPGAFLCAADMAMVFLLNLSYDVSAKLYSFHLLFISVLLLFPDLRRLIKFFLTDRAVEPRSQPRLFKSRFANRVALFAQILLGAYFAAFELRNAIHDWHEFGTGRAKPALYGIWNVEQMKIDGQEHPPLLTDTDRWRRVLLAGNENDDFQIQRMDDTLLYLISSESSDGIDVKDRGPIPLRGYPGHPNLTGHFTLTHPSVDELALDGLLDNRRIHVALKRVDLQQFTLVGRGFHWINDYPFQR